MTVSLSIPSSFDSSSGVRWLANVVASFGSVHEKARRQGTGGQGAQTLVSGNEAQRPRAPSPIMSTEYGVAGDEGNAPSRVRAARCGDRRPAHAVLGRRGGAAPPARPRAGGSRVQLHGAR